MAGRGAPPTPGSRRSKRNTIRLVADGHNRGPALPRDIMRDEEGNPQPWHPMTKRWWQHWRRSPQALRMLTENDWAFLLDTAALHHLFWSGQLEFGPELRIRMAKFGATPEDRSRLFIEIADPTDAEPAASRHLPGENVWALDPRRKRILDESPPTGVDPNA